MAALGITAGSLGAKAKGRDEINLFAGFMNATYTYANQGRSILSYDLFGLYEPSYDITCGPTVTLDYNHRILSWLGAGVQANWAYLYGNGQYVLGNAPVTAFSQHIMAVLPQVKFYIPGPKHFRPYSKVAAGVGFILGDTVVGKPFSFAWDIAPIGFEWGSQMLYATFESAVGNVITGVRFGIGYRF